MDKAIIDIQKLGIRFKENIVHRDISFSVQKGEAITILGPSGAGKTLIFKSIIGLIQPTSGQISVFGEDIATLDEEGMRKVRSRIGMLFQGAALFDSLSVYENIAYSLREHGETDEEKIAASVADKLSIIGLPGIEQKFPPQLSGGQKKRVGLARALASSPQVVLFDEPTTGLDPTAIRLIDELIIRLNQEFGITCISITHDISSARRISNRWLLINNGTIAADGPSEALEEQHGQVQDFVSGNWKQEMNATG